MPVAGSSGAGLVTEGSFIDPHKVHFLFSSITTMSGRFVLFGIIVIIGYLIVYLRFRKSINSMKSPHKSMSVATIWIMIVFLFSMFFSFTDLIFSSKSNPSHQDTEVIE